MSTSCVRAVRTACASKVHCEEPTTGWSCWLASLRRASQGSNTIRTFTPLTHVTIRAMQGKLDQEDFGVALEVQLTMAFMQQGGELGSRVVHTGRDKFLGELSPKLGKPKKHPAYCVYLAYRLERSSAGEERAEEERPAGAATPSSLQWDGEEDEEDEANQVFSFASGSETLFFKKMISSGNGGVGGQAVARQADNGRAGKQRTERGESHPSGITTLELKLS